jgi:hypothetical protein
MATQFESRVQNIVYQLEVGVGANILKAFLYILFMGLVSLLYMARQYQGFGTEQAMDHAQLAVQIAETGQFNTKVIRPGTVRHLRKSKHFKVEDPASPLSGQPDLVNAPGYPLFLSSVFKMTGTDFEAPQSHRYGPERKIIVPLNLAFCFVSGLFMYLIGLRLFSQRVALTALTIFFLSGIPLQRAVQGSELCFALMLYTFSIWCGLHYLKVKTSESPASFRHWGLLILSALSLTLLFLTRYAAIVALPGFLFLLFAGLKRKAWVPALLVLVIMGAGISPWVLRNMNVSGLPFGLAPTAAFFQEPNDMHLRSIYEDVDEQREGLFKAVVIRSVRAVNEALTFENSPMGSGLVFCLFIATYFYSFQRKPIRDLRWALLISYLLLTVSAGLFGLEQMEASFLFFPLVALLGSAFFYLLLDRMQINVKVLSLGVVAIFILFQTVPLLTAMTSPKPYSYPPYNAAATAQFTEPFGNEELFCSDIPWATAWYGNQLSLYLPATDNDFFEINDRIQPIQALYFTLKTMNLPYHSNLLRGPYSSWKGLIDGTAMPRGFPLTFALPFQRGEQIIYTQRSRFFPENP